MTATVLQFKKPDPNARHKYSIEIFRCAVGIMGIILPPELVGEFSFSTREEALSYGESVADSELVKDIRRSNGTEYEYYNTSLRSFNWSNSKMFYSLRLRES